MVGALFCDVGVSAPGHIGYGVCVRLFYGNKVYHSLRRSELMLSAEGHKHGTGTDGGVKSFTESALGADVEVGNECLVAAGEVVGKCFIEALGLLGLYGNVLFGTVGVEELAADIYDSLAVPVHNESCLLGNGSNDCCLEVFGVCKLDELFYILFLNDNRHSLLRFGDSELGAVQSVVLLRYLVKIDNETVCELTDSNGYTACAKVVTALDECSRLFISEEPLQLSFLGGVTLLYLCSASGEGLEGV